MQMCESVVSLQQGELNIDVATAFRREGDDLLILLHGLGCSKESFAGAFDAPELNDYAICAIDFPGHGASSRNLPSDAYSLEAYVEIVGQVISRVMTDWGCNRLYVAGHSMGGAVAVLLPEAKWEVTSLVSIDGNLIAEDCGLVSRGIAEQSLDEFAGHGYAEFNASLYDSTEPGTRAWASWSAFTAPDAMHAAARSLVEWSDSGKLLEQFNAIRKSAFLYGERDNKQYLLPHIGGATICAVPDAAHFMMVDNPRDFYRILDAALESNGVCSAGFGGEDTL